jgi:hypothetical protein
MPVMRNSILGPSLLRILFSRLDPELFWNVKPMFHVFFKLSASGKVFLKYACASMQQHDEVIHSIDRRIKGYF